MADVSEAVTALQKVIATQSQPVPRFNTEIIRSAWNAAQRRRREARRAARRAVSSDGMYDSEIESDPLCYAYIEQLWTDHIIVRISEDGPKGFLRIPFTITSPGTEVDHVKFGAPEKVQQAYVAASARRGQDALSQLVALRDVSVKERESLKGKKQTLPGTTSYPINSLKDLSNAIQAYGRSKPEDRQRLKAHLLRHARRLGASQAVIDRIQSLGKADSVKASADLTDVISLARVRTQAGVRRYRKPLGSPLGGAPSGEPLASVARTGSLLGAGVTADKLRKSIKDVSEEKTYAGRKVFGDINSEGKLKKALSQIEGLSENQRGKAAAEVVKAAQSLGLTALVPATIKRLYRQYIAQSRIKVPSRAPSDKK